MNRNRVTGIRITLEPDNCTKDEIIQWMSAQRKLTNYASKHLLRLMRKDASIAEIVFKNNSHYLAYEVHHHILLPFTSFREERIKLGLRTSTNERLAAAIAGRFYHGYGQRNGSKKDVWAYALPKLPAITRQNKAVHVKDSVLRKFVDGNTITVNPEVINGQQYLSNVRFELQGLFGKIYKLKGKILSKHIHLLEFLDLKENVDCNIFLTKHGNITIMIRIDEEYELMYQPTQTLGVDFNKRKNVFVTMNDGTFIPLTSEIAEKIQCVKESDESIHEVKSSKLRQTFRMQWKQCRKELRHSLRNIANEIITKAIVTESLLAIDGVTQSQGSFGHAELKEMLVKLCKQKKVPFVIVPSAHTSSDCSYCFERSGKYNQVARSKDFEKVSCEVCGENYNADVNAARNIAQDGWFIFTNTIEDFPKDKFGRAIRSNRPATSVANRKKKMKFIDFTDPDVTF